MVKTTCDIKRLCPEAEKEILEQTPDGALVLVLDLAGGITPLAIGRGETQFLDRKTAEEKARASKYTSLPKSLTISFGTGSGWCLVDDGTGDLIWVYHP
ncbi:MAG: hypothetical protein V3V31_13080 [Methylococcales bacterium]